MKGNYKKPSELLKEQKETGKSYWDLIGRPLYDDGKDSDSEESVKQNEPASQEQLDALRYIADMALDSYNNGKDEVIPDEVDKYAGLSYSSSYPEYTGDIPMDVVLSRKPQFKKGKGDQRPANFVNQIAPSLYRSLNKYKVYSPQTFDNTMRQLAWESNYGLSNVAIKNNNFGGVGFNGKTYYKYKNVDDFTDSYVKLLKSRYSNALAAKDTTAYARELKKRGYFQDTLEHYSSNLANMSSLNQALQNHMKANPKLYQYSDVVERAKARQAAVEERFTYRPQPKHEEPYIYDGTVPEYISGASSSNANFVPMQSNLPPIEQILNSINEGNPILKPVGYNYGKSVNFWQRRGNNMHLKPF